MSCIGTGTVTNGPWWVVLRSGRPMNCKSRAKVRMSLFNIVFLRDINIESHCEHHMVPIAGKAHVAYLPKDKVVGISKLARVIEIFAKRLQTQETMTMQIINTIDETLEPFGSAIMIDAKHQCMTTRGINKPNVSTITTKFTGLFAEDAELRNRFMQLIKE